MEYLVRAARVTDIDRIVALGDDSVRIGRAESPLGAADLMRQLVYLPQASIVVAEVQRAVVGGAILALRPSVVAGGYVGTIDFLVIDPEHDAERITAALLEELLRSASNKGCTVVEADRPDGELLERWQRSRPETTACAATSTSSRPMPCSRRPTRWPSDGPSLSCAT